MHQVAAYYTSYDSFAWYAFNCVKRHMNASTYMRYMHLRSSRFRAMNQLIQRTIG